MSCSALPTHKDEILRRKQKQALRDEAAVGEMFTTALRSKTLKNVRV